MRLNMKSILRKSGCLFLVLILVGLPALGVCASKNTVKKGIFIDSPVSGLMYKTPTQSGVTDGKGAFTYRAGETVAFSLGGVVLGSAPGKAVLTPIDLVPGATDPGNQAVSNISAFLQTLDEDGDLNNGIKINAHTRDIVAAKAVGLHFNQASESFAADPIVVGLMNTLNTDDAAGFISGDANGRTLRSAEDAREHLKASLSKRKTVVTAPGPVKGYADSGVWVWKGVPFAKPPVQSRRWKAPLNPDPWKEVREATAACNECTQQIHDPHWRSSGVFKGSEDCLYLDIYRPRSDKKNLPVYVYFHGGANNFGSAKQHNGLALAKRGDMIVIFVQYRLAALGFLTHPALRTTGTDEDKSGNYGILDQIQALKWVKKNIAAFGGNPGKVVIGGQSAGAHNSLNLIISPKTAGLFRGAIPQSAAMEPFTKAQADAMTNKTIEGLLIRDGLAENPAKARAYREGMADFQIETYLRSKTAGQLMQARRDGTGPVRSGSMPVHSAIRDGAVVRDKTWVKAFAAGAYNKVALMIGSTQFEFKSFSPLYGIPFKGLSAGKVPSGTKTWMDLYKVIGVGGNLTVSEVLLTQADRELYQTFNNLTSRQWKANNVDVLARTLKNNDPANKVYAYEFRWKAGGDPDRADFEELFGAAHAMDIPFFQGQTQDAWNYSFTERNKPGREALQGAMMDYLISFVRTLDPNPAGSTLPKWPQWGLKQGEPKFITFDADLNRYIIGTEASEIILSDLNPEINAARQAYPDAVKAFTLFGLVPVNP